MTGRTSIWTWTVTALLACSLPAAAQTDNLFTNGGFEDGARDWELDVGHRVVNDPSAAHSGRSCLLGEVTKPKRALRLQRTVRVKAGNRYLFEAWARSDNRCKLVLFATLPGETKRQLLAAWKSVPRRWTRYRFPFSVPRSGLLKLEVISPSSFAAPTGRLWLDDLALHETEMPPLVVVSDQKGFDDEPSLAAATDGTLYVAWNSFRDGADSLQVARYAVEGQMCRPLGRWQVVGGSGTYLFTPTVVPTDGGVQVLYAAEVDGNWDIYAVACGPDGPSRPVRLTTDPAVDVKPAAAFHNGTLWLAWESNRNGVRQVFVREVRNGQPGPVTPLSFDDCNSYHPSLAVTDDGRVCVAWYSFRQNNMDVFLRCRQQGQWGRPRRLTQAPSIDRHPVLFTRGNELWIVYENSQTGEYYVGRTSGRHLLLARVTDDGLQQPKVVEGTNPLASRCEAPSPLFDQEGRLWLAFLRPRPPRSGWDTYFTCYKNGRWSKPQPVSLDKGMDRRPAAVRVGNALVVAFQSDNIPNSWSDVDQTPKAWSRIQLAVVDVGADPNVRPIATEPLVESSEPFAPAQLRVARGEDRPTPTIQYKGQTLKLFFGSLHEHSDISVCNRIGDESVDENYQSMRDLTRHDFACLTDHGYNMNAYLWNYTAKMARINNDPGRFLTFLAEEWTSSFEEYSTEHPYGFYGHRNLILADPYFPRWWNARNRQTPAEVWEDLRKLNANFIHIPHQLADTGNVPTDWNFHDPVAQPVAEIFQTRGSYEYLGAPRQAKRATPTKGYFLQDAWARGLVIGVIAAPDHGGGYGKACVYAPELTREAILDALRQRHCYGTTAAKIFLDVRVNGHLMGEVVPDLPKDRVEIEIRVSCPAEIARVEVCRNNRFIYSTNPDGREARLRVVDADPLSERSYYYVRVIQEDNEIAWSSPVWFGAKVAR